VHAERKGVELEDEVLAPRKDPADVLAMQALDADLAVPCDASDRSPYEWLQLLGGQTKRRAFHPEGDLATCGPAARGEGDRNRREALRMGRGGALLLQGFG
jgi:hypothetical protein